LYQVKKVLQSLNIGYRTEFALRLIKAMDKRQRCYYYFIDYLAQWLLLWWLWWYWSHQKNNPSIMKCL